MKNKYSRITLIRLTLCGSIAGIALVGVIAPFFGFPDTSTRDLTGAVAGGGLSAALLKLAHLA